MAEVENIIPDNADKILFAEDLMNYMLDKTLLQEIPVLDTVELHRQLIHNAFDETMKKAVDFLCSQLHEGDYNKFVIMQRMRIVNRNIFLSLAKKLRKRYFSKGFEARKFLYYCVHLGNEAVLYWASGVLEGPRLGVICILKAFERHGMFSGGWNLLSRMASVYADMSPKNVKVHLVEIPINNLILDYKSMQPSNQLTPTTSPDSSNSDDDEFDLDTNETVAGRESREFILRLLDLDDFLIATEEWKNRVCRVMNLPEVVELEEIDSSQYGSTYDNDTDGLEGSEEVQPSCSSYVSPSDEKSTNWHDVSRDVLEVFEQESDVE